MNQVVKADLKEVSQSEKATAMAYSRECHDRNVYQMALTAYLDKHPEAEKEFYDLGLEAERSIPRYNPQHPAMAYVRPQDPTNLVKVLVPRTNFERFRLSRFGFADRETLTNGVLAAGPGSMRIELPR